MILVVMAAGMGSRFGGLKQIEPMDEFNNFIIDYSIYDAIEAGFDSVVFIIKEEMYDDFLWLISSEPSAWEIAKEKAIAKARAEEQEKAEYQSCQNGNIKSNADQQRDRKG